MEGLVAAPPSGFLQTERTRALLNVISMNVRRAATGDLPKLLPLVRAYREFYAQHHDEARERAFMQGHLQDESSIVFVAVDGPVIGAFAQLFVSHSTVHLARVLVLEDLYVDPAWRRRGAATHLLQAACDHARGINAVGMFLETARDNVVAQSVYERSGWVREGRFLKYNAPL